MVNRETLTGNWHEIKGRIQEKWGQVTGDELDQVEGNVEQLVGLIQKKTGQAREKIRDFIRGAS